MMMDAWVYYIKAHKGSKKEVNYVNRFHNKLFDFRIINGIQNRLN